MSFPSIFAPFLPILFAPVKLNSLLDTKGPSPTCC
jgi:hypothetical protein